MSIALDFPKEGIARVLLSRPEKRNALNGMMVASFIAALSEVTKLAQHGKCRVLLIEGAGKDFCAGADLEWMKKMAVAGVEENQADALQLATLFRRIHEMPVPVLALVQGATMGGGMGIVSACSLVIAATDAFFCFPEVRIGLVPYVVSPWVIAAIGRRAAGYYFTTAEKITVDVALRLGLLHRMVPAADLQSEGLKLARELSQFESCVLSEVRTLLSEPLLTDELTAGRLAKLRRKIWKAEA